MQKADFGRRTVGRATSMLSPESILLSLSTDDAESLRAQAQDKSGSVRNALMSHLKLLGLSKLGDRQRALNQLLCAPTTLEASVATPTGTVVSDTVLVPVNVDKQAIPLDKPGALAIAAAPIAVRQVVVTTPDTLPPIPVYPDNDLSAEKCAGLLSELLQRYNQPDFLASLATLRNGDPRDYLRKLGPLVLTVQAPLLSKYGLQPNATGVDSMKHAIMRRIAEGHPKLQDMANEARYVLGVAPIPGLRGKTAEEAMVEMLGEPSKTGSTTKLLVADVVATAEDALRSGQISTGSAKHLRWMGAQVGG